MVIVESVQMFESDGGIAGGQFGKVLHEFEICESALAGKCV